MESYLTVYLRYIVMGLGGGRGNTFLFFPVWQFFVNTMFLKSAWGLAFFVPPLYPCSASLPQACFFNPVFAQPLSPTLATFLHFICLPCVNTQTQATLKKNACFQCSVQSTVRRGEVCSGRRLKPMLVSPLQPAGENRESLCSTPSLLSLAGPACE